VADGAGAGVCAADDGEGDADGLAAGAGEALAAGAGLADALGAGEGLAEAAGGDGEADCASASPTLTQIAATKINMARTGRG